MQEQVQECIYQLIMVIAWTAVNTGLTNLNVQSLAVSDTIIFAGIEGGYVFRSTDFGK